VTNVERYRQAALDDADRDFERVMAQARMIAKVPGLKKEIQGQADAVAGIALQLKAYGLPVTIPGINMAFDWIEGRAEPSSMFFSAVARQNGYRVWPIERSSEKAVAQITSPDGDSLQVTFALADAIAAHRLDEWVEDYVATGDHYQDSGKAVRRKVVRTVRVNGEPVDGDLLEEWAIKQLNAGAVKRFDAWWNYRTDMLWKSAVKRAVKIACPHVLLGGTDVEHEAFTSAPTRPPGWGSPVAAGQGAPVIDVAGADRPPPSGPARGGSPPPAPGAPARRSAPAGPDPDDERPF
jgi:hypothetical protein